MSQAANLYPDKEVVGKLVAWSEKAKGFRFQEVMTLKWAPRAAVGVGAVSVLANAARAESIAQSMVSNACAMKNGDPWGAIGLNQDMQDLAPGLAGHLAWLKVIGEADF
jgi:hypothetical protein